MIREVLLELSMNYQVRKCVVVMGAVGVRRVAALSVVAFAFALAPCVGSAAEPDTATLEMGKVVFSTDAVPACAVCHTLDDAGATGAIGPNLDELKPSFSHVKSMVEQGAGAMPGFADTLSEEQIDAVSAYVAHITGGDPS